MKISTIIIIIVLRYVDLDTVGSRRICFNVSDFILCWLADIWFLSVVEIHTCTPVYNIRKLFITYFLVQAPKTDKQTNKQPFEFGSLFCRIIPFKLTEFVFNSGPLSFIMYKINIRKQ